MPRGVFCVIMLSMAKTSYIDIPPEIDEFYFSGLQPGDRFTFARIGRKNKLLSRKAKKGVSQKSLLPEIATVWATLSGAEKTAWSSAGAQSNLNGWRLFIQDYCARRVNDLAGLATPSLLHQSWVGQLQISAPASEAKLIQAHPRNYYIKKKIIGTKSMYSPVLITEDITLPITLSINYNSDLTAEGANPYAKLYAEIWYSYQGRNLFYLLEIPFDLSTGWKTATVTSPSLVSYVVGYDLYLHLHDLRGDLFFDNVKVTHGGQNWVRDPFCKDVNQGFTRNFYQVSKHWAAIIAPDGVLLETVYKDF